MKLKKLDKVEVRYNYEPSKTKACFKWEVWCIWNDKRETHSHSFKSRESANEKASEIRVNFQ